MSLTLHFHPFSSYCQKVLVALYEAGTAFAANSVNLGDPDEVAALRAVWPMGKFPVLVDAARGATVAESSVIIEYLDRHHAGPAPMLPADPDVRLQVRMLDRCFDNYVMTPMNKLVGDAMRAPEARDAQGVAEARALLHQAYGWLESELPDGGWAAGDAFTLADCAAAPSLFYADLVEPLDGYPRLGAYLKRLRARPSFARAVEEARYFRPFFPPGWPEGRD